MVDKEGMYSENNRQRLKAGRYRQTDRHADTQTDRHADRPLIR